MEKLFLPKSMITLPTLSEHSPLNMLIVAQTKWLQLSAFGNFTDQQLKTERRQFLNLTANQLNEWL